MDIDAEASNNEPARCATATHNGDDQYGQVADSISTASKLDGLSSENSCSEEYADNESNQDKSADGSNLSSDENASNKSSNDESLHSSNHNAHCSDRNDKLDGLSSENSCSEEYTDNESN